MKDELMRRISRAIDAEAGLAGDAELSAEIRKDPEAARYAKDLSRLNVWLGGWPLPEPDAASMEALAARIEQRLDDKLPAIMDPTLPPDFDDDDSLRDATAGLLHSGEHTVASGEYTLAGEGRGSKPEVVSDSQLEVVSMPMLEIVSSSPQLDVSHEGPTAVSHESPAAVSHESPAAVSHESPAAVSHESPAAVSHEAPAAGPALELEPVDDETDASGRSKLAKVQLKKREVRGAVEEHAAASSGEPLSAADLQVRLTSAAPKKKKKKAAAEGDPAPAKVIPLKDLAGKKDERISIPTPPARMAQGTLAPVKDLPKEKERSGSGAMWWLAAAAAVGLGVFGASNLLSTGSAPTTGQTITAAATSTIAPATPAAAPAPPPPPVAPAEEAAAMAAAEPVTAAPPVPMGPMPMAPPATVVTVPSTGYAGPVARPRAALAADSLAEGDTPARRAAPARIASGGGGSGASAFDDSYGAPSASRGHASASGATTRSTASVPTTTPAPAPAPPPTQAAVAPAPTERAESLPDTPDRDAIQQALGAVTPAVQACGAGEHGVADVDIVIASSGRVTTATVNGRFAGTPIGSCIARAVRGARFAPFAQPRYEVTYPFHL
jgi:hypothetical protein